MKVLTVDIGTGTQDIFLYDSRLAIENGFKLIVPSPTMMIFRRLQAATRRGQAVLLQGVTMGGGPSQWAAEAHLRAGLPLYATPQAARSFNDDLDEVQAMGVHIVSEEEAERLPPTVERLEFKDFDAAAITRALEAFGVSLKGLAAVAVGVFDHGEAPPGYSDRQFRFDYLDRRIRTANRLSAFAYLADEVPLSLTRMKAVVQSAQNAVPWLEGTPLVVMDTAPAAVLGATWDPQVRAQRRSLIANVGNFHTLAFRLGPNGIEGVFEHHTGLLDASRLEGLLRALAAGTLTHDQVFEDHGHGALIYHPEPLPLEEGKFGVVVTGPRRNLLRESGLRPYFAAPFGDMMITGCIGLLAATADLLPPLAETIYASLKGEGNSGTPPWEVLEE